jgi:hypothetical protein
VRAGALVGVAVGFGFGVEKSPVKIRERTTMVNDKMCLGIHTS